ncbi:hypothetical protein F1728_19790 [Gimesia benthica]|uniref:Uncharacterized protein n=1 Tax=Gimesia benthica TaxID=2608982 RepID=A0A6I6AJH2_9PLAN|nr:hypothetical protein [Gimesia benthica]QGQ24789.1 hypothetical protein F1728_19790 [Gimesia benthica]
MNKECFTPESLMQMNFLYCDSEFAALYEQWFDSHWSHIGNAGVWQETGQLSLRFGLTLDDDINQAVRELNIFLPLIDEITDDSLSELGKFKCLKIDHIAPERGLYFLGIQDVGFYIMRVGIGTRISEYEAQFTDLLECVNYIARNLPRNEGSDSETTF